MICQLQSDQSLRKKFPKVLFLIKQINQHNCSVKIRDNLLNKKELKM